MQQQCTHDSTHPTCQLPAHLTERHEGHGGGKVLKGNARFSVGQTEAQEAACRGWGHDANPGPQWSSGFAFSTGPFHERTKQSVRATNPQNAPTERTTTV